MKSFYNKSAVIVFATLALASAHSSDSIINEMQKYEKAIQQILPNKKGKLTFEKILEKKNSTTGFNPKQIFEIESNNKHYIFRKFSEKDSIKKRVKEIQMVQIVSNAGFGPSLIGAPKNNEFYIVDFAGRAITYKDLSDETLKNIGKIVRKIHDFKFLEKGISLQNRLKKHYKKCIKKGVALPSDFHGYYEDYIKKNKNSSAKIGFCHGNLKPTNIRVDEKGKITIINWKNAGNGDVFEDIGCFTLTNGLNDNQIGSFMEGYLGRPAGLEDINKIKDAAYKTCLLTSAICFEFSENKKDKKIPLEKRVEALDKMICSPDGRDVFEYPRKAETPSLFSKNKEEIKEYAVSAWKKYEQTLAPKQGIFTRLKKWIKSYF